MAKIQEFGGDWTKEKLARLRAYLAAYMLVMKKQSFELYYIDAFAGTGYRQQKNLDEQDGLLFPDQADLEGQAFQTGSARIALEVEPGFHKYYFIEVDQLKCKELERLRSDFPIKTGQIYIFNEEANQALERLCQTQWIKERKRGIIFLDPFGMNVKWSTVEAIANTEAIDMWYLFPLGIGVNRLLRRDGNIPLSWQEKLDNIFGDRGWRDVFYRKITTDTLLDFIDESDVRKANVNQIASYFVARLKEVFAGVAEQPLTLYNSRNNPLYLLCFACGNKTGKDIALNIAEHILKG